MKRKIQYRKISQILFFVIIGGLAVNNALSEIGNGLAYIPAISLHAICPFGGVETLYNLLTIGNYVKNIAASSVIILAISLILSILFGPVICGWVCPLGSLQEWTGIIGKKIFKKKYNQYVDPKLDKILRFLRYAVLVWVLYVTARSGTLLFKNIDPYYALFNFFTGEVAPTALLILGLTIGGSLFIERPWCKYACPYGAVLGLSNKFRIFKIRRTPSTCINCKKCDRECPMNISISEQEVITDHQCISCMKCTSDQACPVKKTVEFKTK
jgi:polyferredoxin